MSKLIEAASEFLGRDTSTKGNHFTEAMNKEPLMHYQQTMASIIKRYPGEAKDRDQIANHHAKVMKASNPNFDHKGFLKAAGVVKEEVEDNEMYIKLLSQEEFNELAEEDQNIYIDAIHQLQELSPETLRSYQKKANKSIDKQQKIKMTPGSPEAKARSVKGLTRMGAIDRANEKEFLGRMDRAINQKKAGQ